MRALVDDWLGELRRAGIVAVAVAFGLESPRARSVRPCPACDATRRGSSDRRGPIGVRRDNLGWRCHVCRESGDAGTLASLCVFGQPRPPEGRWAELRRACADRGLCDRAPSPRQARPAAPPPRRPPLAEIEDVWARAARVIDHPTATAWLEARGIAADVVASLDLARVIPRRARLPRWARFRGRPWSETGHRLVVPLVSARGALQSLHARSVLARAPGASGKAASPAGAETVGLLLANPIALAWLRGEREPTEISIVEGVPDFLASSAAYPDAAVVGILAGSWTDDVAARVPSAAHVTIHTHADAAGDAYAARIAATLAGRAGVTRR